MRDRCSRSKRPAVTEFTTTPNHKVLTLRGWVAVKALHVGDRLCDATVREAPGVPGRSARGTPRATQAERGLSAAHRAFGSERMQRGTVDFHGDRPMGEVDVVTVDRDLLAVDPSAGQPGEDLHLLRSLLRKGPLLGEGPLAQHFGTGCRDGRVTPVFPDDRVLAAPRAALFQGEPVQNEIVRLRDAAGRDAVLAQNADDGPLANLVDLSEPMDGLTGKVAAHDLGLVRDVRTPELAGLGYRAQRNASLTEHPADHVLVDSQCAAQAVDRLAGHVPAADAGNIHICGYCETESLKAASWLDAVFIEDLTQGAPVAPVKLAQRCERVAGEIPLDEIIGIDLCLPAAHEEPFVYTLETTTGAYRSSSVVHQNCRSAALWLMRDLLDPSHDPDLALPVDDELLGDLTAPKWRILSGGRIQVESKDDIRKRIGRSTDAGDATVQAFWEEGHGATAWIDWARKKAEQATDPRPLSRPPSRNRNPPRSYPWTRLRPAKHARDAAWRQQRA